MKTIKLFIARGVIALIMAVFMLAMIMPVPMAKAGTLTTPRDYMNRVKENLTSGVQHEIFFTTEGAVSGGAGNNEVILLFPDADDGDWCATAGTGTATGITDPTGGSETASVLPGTLAVSCTQGSGGSSYDTITVTGVDDLTVTTKYGVRITDTGTGSLGTPANTSTGLITVKTNNGAADIDSANTSVDIITDDQIAVSAVVPPSITFTISSNTVDLGTLSTGSVSTGSHTIQTVTNASSGYTTLVYDDDNLRKGSDTIDDVGDGAVTAGSEEYGIATSDSGQTISQDSDCSNSPYTASALTTTQQSIAGATSGPVDETITICYAASISATTIAGSYAHTVTFITSGLF